jgi:RNA polymerase sigma factor FliA
MSNPAASKLKRYSQASPPGAPPDLSPDEREKLILQYAPLVKTIAGRLGMRLPQHVGQDDLVSAGIMGLLDAVDKFNEDKGVAFKSYAEFRIRGAMLDELRAMDWVPRSVRRNARKLEAAFAKVENETMRPAADEEVAEELGIDMEAYYGLLEETRGISVISEDELGQALPAGGSDHHPKRTPGGMIPDNPSDSLDLTEIRDVIAGAIEKLPKKERTVVSLYYYEELTMKEIGNVMEYTESRISQLHTKAVLRLRGALRGYFELEGA